MINLATDNVISDGHNITCTLSTRKVKPLQATHSFITSLLTSPKAHLHLVSEKLWSLESTHWIRDTQPGEDDHSYRGNGAGVKKALRTAAPC